MLFKRIVLCYFNKEKITIKKRQILNIKKEDTKLYNTKKKYHIYINRHLKTINEIARMFHFIGDITLEDFQIQYTKDTEVCNYTIDNLIDIFNELNIPYKKYLTIEKNMHPFIKKLNRKIKNKDIDQKFVMKLYKELNQTSESIKEVSTILLSDKLISLIDNYCHVNKVKRKNLKILKYWKGFIMWTFQRIDTNDSRSFDEKLSSYLDYLFDASSRSTPEELLGKNKNTIYKNKKNKESEIKWK